MAVLYIKRLTECVECRVWMENAHDVYYILLLHENRKTWKNINGIVDVDKKGKSEFSSYECQLHWICIWRLFSSSFFIWLFFLTIAHLQSDSGKLLLHLISLFTDHQNKKTKNSLDPIDMRTFPMFIGCTERWIHKEWSKYEGLLYAKTLIKIFSICWDIGSKLAKMNRFHIWKIPN